MPHLGAYAVEVGLAYAVSIVLLIAIVWTSVAQSRRTKKSLDEAEARWSKNG